MRLMLSLCVLALAACTPGGASAQTESGGQPLADAPPPGMSVAIFAGWCFWCMEGPFEELGGVQEVLSGYTGGPEENPTYHQVASGSTGHTEAVRVVYDPGVMDYGTLLGTFWRSMDPTDSGGQFADRGTQYRPAIYVSTDEERATAETSKAALEADGPFDEPIIVPIEDAGAFYVAEDYHQDYYRTNTAHYQMYRSGSGRTGFLAQHWGDAAH